MEYQCWRLSVQLPQGVWKICGSEMVIRCAYDELVEAMNCLDGTSQSKTVTIHGVSDTADRAEHSAAHAGGEANDPPLAVAHTGDAVEGALDSGAVVGGEFADTGDDVFEVFLEHLAIAEQHLFTRITGFGAAAKIEDDFEELEVVGAVAEAFGDLRGQNVEKELQIVGDVQHLYLAYRHRFAC